MGIMTANDVEKDGVYLTKWRGHVKITEPKARKGAGRWYHRGVVVRQRPNASYSPQVEAVVEIAIDEILHPVDSAFQPVLTPAMKRRAAKLEAAEQAKKRQAENARNWGDDAIRFLGAAGVNAVVQTISVNSRPRKPHLCIPTSDLSALVPMLERLAEEHVKWLVMDQEVLVGDSIAELSELLGSLDDDSN